MVPAAYHIGPGGQDAAQVSFGNSETIRGIFAVHHDKIRALFLDKPG
jgi:hypothetical protein